MCAQVNDIALLLLDRPSTMRPLLHLPPGAALGATLANRCNDSLVACLACWHATYYGPSEGPPSPHTACPAAVPRPAVGPGTPLTALGWGMAGESVNASFDWPAILQEVSRPAAPSMGRRGSQLSCLHSCKQATLEMISRKECAARFAEILPGEKWDAQFCAGGQGWGPAGGGGAKGGTKTGVRGQCMPLPCQCRPLQAHGWLAPSGHPCVHLASQAGLRRARQLVG